MSQLSWRVPLAVEIPLSAGLPPAVPAAAGGADDSARRPITIASTQNPAKMAPSAYITGTTTPAAMTST